MRVLQLSESNNSWKEKFVQEYSGAPNCVKKGSDIISMRITYLIKLRFEEKPISPHISTEISIYYINPRIQMRTHLRETLSLRIHYIILFIHKYLAYISYFSHEILESRHRSFSIEILLYV